MLDQKIFTPEFMAKLQKIQGINNLPDFIKDGKIVLTSDIGLTQISEDCDSPYPHGKKEQMHAQGELLKFFNLMHEEISDKIN